ncbi:hypothetical protein VPNG_10218 [Cytospora leucostoma]|uniref:Uncharacterized protein n=1 Tax=Cytospora leucostoma TaxID=1230097 RepID=A0A423VDZ9_9PEZI|nr:hypothetical protein VPNG_10218 [Cytospora leucostoma]
MPTALIDLMLADGRPSDSSAAQSAAPLTRPQEESCLAPSARVGPRITYPERLVGVVLPVVILVARVVVVVVLVHIAPVLEQLLVAPDLPGAVPLLLGLLVGREAGVGVDACRESLVAASLNEGLDLGLQFLAEELHQDVLLRAAGVVGGGVDDDTLEGGGVLLEDLEEVGHVLIEDAGGGLEGLSVEVETQSATMFGYKWCTNSRHSRIWKWVVHVYLILEASKGIAELE